MNKYRVVKVIPPRKGQSGLGTFEIHDVKAHTPVGALHSVDGPSERMTAREIEALKESEKKYFKNR